MIGKVRSWHCSCRIYFFCFLLALANIRPWRLVPFSQISLKCWSQGTVNLKLPKIPFGIVACAFFRQPFSKQLYMRFKGSHPVLPWYVLWKRESSSNILPTRTVRNVQRPARRIWLFGFESKYLMTGTEPASAISSRCCCLLTRARIKSQNPDNTLYIIRY